MSEDQKAQLENEARKTLQDLSPQEAEAVGRVYQNRQGVKNRARDDDTVRAARTGLQQAKTLDPVFKRESAKVKNAGEEGKLIVSAVKSAQSIADTTWGKVAKVHADDTIPRDARQRQVNEKLQEAKKQIKEKEDQAHAAYELARAKLTTRAIGKPDPSRERFAREDAAATLSAASSVPEGLQQLAQDPDDDVRSLAAGPWGRRRLEAAGVPHVEEQWSNIQRQAVEAAGQHGSTAKKSAAQAAKELEGAKGFLSFGGNYTSLALDGWDRSSDGK